MKSSLRRAPLHPDVPLLARVPAFTILPEAVLAGLTETCPVVTFAAGETLLEQGEPGDHALAILSGRVEVVNDSRHGRAHVGELAAPHLIGEVAALAEMPRTASVVALEPVHARRLSRAQMLELARLTPETLQVVIGHLGQQIRGLNAALGLYAAGCEALGNNSLDLSILEDLSRPAVQVAGFARAFEGLARNITRERRQRAEMESAALLQRTMLPQDMTGLPPCGRAEIAALMIPARNVGGDFYDAFMIGHDKLALVVGDVCGKGVPASLFMCVSVTTLRMVARDREALGPMVDHVNDLLCAQNPSGMFATAFFAVLDLPTRRLDFVNCGHNRPYLLRADGSVEALPAGGVPLGVMPGRSFVQRSVDLAPGDGLFLFTDGVTESNDPDHREFGDERLAATLADHAGAAPGELCAAVAAAVERFAGAAEQFDDITCLAARLRA